MLGASNLIPVWAIGIAHVSLGEPLTVQTIIGALSILFGTELVRRKPLWAACSAKRRVLHLRVAVPSLHVSRFAPRRGDTINRLPYSRLTPWMTSGPTIEVCIACR